MTIQVFQVVGAAASWWLPGFFCFGLCAEVGHFKKKVDETSLPRDPITLSDDDWGV